MNKAKKYLITLAVGILIVVLVCLSYDIFSATMPVVVFQILCNAFCIAGTCLVCAGLLIFSSNGGTFDMIVYGVGSFVDMFRRESRKKYDTFYDYRVSREEKKLKFGYLVLCGIGFIAVSLVMYYFYLQNL